MLSEDVLRPPQAPEDLPSTAPNEFGGGLTRSQLVQLGRRGEAVQHRKIAEIAKEALDFPARYAVGYEGGDKVF